MQEMRAEYKLLIGIGIIFTFILLFFLLKENYFKDLANKYKESRLVTCTEEKEKKGIEYRNHTCIIKDETGKNYTISYLQIEEKNDDINKLNRKLKEEFDEILNSVKYYEGNEELQLSSYQTTNYKVYNSNNIVSIVIKKRDFNEEIINPFSRYEIYNLDSTTYEIIDTKDLKKRVGIDRDYSSSLRGKIVKMYLDEFRYDYNNELSTERNKLIDDSIESITYDAIDTIYLDDDGIHHNIMYIYNPNYRQTIPYKFSLDKNNNIIYEIIES